MIRPAASLLPPAVALAVMVVWGATPVATRLAVAAIDPITVALLRTVVGGAAALAVALAFRVPRPRGPRAMVLVAVAGFAGFVAFPLIYCVGQQRTSALHGALILAALPVITGFWAAVVERRWPRRRWFVGCAVALCGEALLVGGRVSGAGGPADAQGDLMIAASALIVGAGYVVGARATQLGTSSLGTTLWGLGFGAVVLLPVLAATGAGLPSAGVVPWSATLYLALVTSIVGYIGWYWALARGGIQRIALYQFLQPISGLLLAVAVLDERPSLALLVAGALVLGGLTVAQRR